MLELKSPQRKEVAFDELGRLKMSQRTAIFLKHETTVNYSTILLVSLDIIRNGLQGYFLPNTIIN